METLHLEDNVGVEMSATTQPKLQRGHLHAVGWVEREGMNGRANGRHWVRVWLCCGTMQSVFPAAHVLFKHIGK